MRCGGRDGTITGRGGGSRASTGHRDLGAISARSRQAWDEWSGGDEGLYDFIRRINPLPISILTRAASLSASTQWDTVLIMLLTLALAIVVSIRLGRQ